MKVVAFVLGALVVAACTAQPDVAAERRTEIQPTDDAGTGAASNPPTVAAPPMTAPPPTPTAPPDAVTVPDDPRARALLLVDGDVPGWEIGGPQLIQPTTYGGSNCPQVDTVRSVDASIRLQTTGRGSGSGFYNMVLDMGSEEEAAAVIDAAATAWQDCPDFSDGRGPGWLEPLDLPDGGWDAAGLVIGTQQEPVLLGYWRWGRTVVKLRVVGADAYESFAVLTEVVAVKLSDARSTWFDEVPTATTEPDPGTRSSGSDTWQSHPLAPRILDPAALGSTWELEYVDVIDPQPGGGTDSCGTSAPPIDDGLRASLYDPDSDSSIDQWVRQSSEDVARRWMDFSRAVAACDENLDPLYVVAHELIPYDGGDLPWADDVAFVRTTVVDETNTYVDETWTKTMMSGVVRYGGTVVQINLATFSASADGIEPRLSAVVRLLQLAEPG